MEDEDVIRDQMENTRTALSEKLEKLESRVSATVQGASQEVAQTVENVTESVQETVETVKDSVQDTVDSVKDTVAETLSTIKHGVDAVKQIFDIPAHVERHPWVAVGGSVAIGYVIGERLTRRSERRPARSSENFPQRESTIAPAYSNGRTNGVSNVPVEKPDTKPNWLKYFEPELAKLKGLALGVLMGTVREMVTQASGEKLGQSLAQIIDSATEKMGGTRIEPATLQDAFKEVETPEPAAMTV